MKTLNKTDRPVATQTHVKPERQERGERPLRPVLLLIALLLAGLASVAGFASRPASAGFPAAGREIVGPAGAAPMGGATATGTPTACSFGTATNYPLSGTGPISVVIGNFNADSNPDLVTVNYTTTNITLLLGNGAGGFAFGFTAPTGGTNSHAIATGDFNLDSNLDLVTANAGSDNVSVLLGSGTGGFGTPTTYAVGGNSPWSIAVGNFNPDSNPDLVAVNATSNNVSVLLGNGTGGFGAPTAYAVGTFPASVAVGDFNLDGALDLVTANRTSNNVSVLLGNGTGGFGAATTYAVGGLGPNSLAVGNVNQDSVPDLVTANNNSNNVSVLLGNGTGGFGAATTYAVGVFPASVTVGDFNLNGTLDLVTANQNGNVSVLLGNGTGGFGAATNYTAGTNPVSIAVGDFNLNGTPDLVTTNYTSNNVSVLLNGCVAPTATRTRTATVTTTTTNTRTATTTPTSTSTPLPGILCVDDVAPYAPGAPCSNAQTYQTIRDAVHAADPGAYIRVAGGTYHSEVVSRTVTIMGGYQGGAGGFNISDPITNGTGITYVYIGSDASLGNFTLGGTLEGPATATLTGTVTLSSASMSGAGVTNLQSGATLDMAGAITINTRTFNNAGTFNYNNNAGDIIIINGGTFNNSGTFNVFRSILYFTANSTGTFNNSGTLRNPGPTYRQVHNSSANLIFNNSGNIDVPDAGGTLHFQIGTYNILSGTTVTGAGFAQVGQFNGIWNVVGTTNAQNIALDWTTNCITCSGITGTGTLNISGVLNWGATLMGSGVTNLLPGATANINSGDLVGRTFNNQGTTNFQNGNLNIIDGGTFNNIGTFNMLQNFNLSNSNNTTGTFNNSGVFRKPGATYHQILKPHNLLSFNNTGTIDVPDAGGTLHFLQGTYNLLTGTTVTGAGFALVGQQSGTWNVAGTANAQNVALGLTANCSTCSGITGTATLNISGVLNWDGTLMGSGVTNLLPGATANISGISKLDERTFNNQGTTNFANSGTLTFYNAATFNNTGTANTATGSYCNLAAAPDHTGTFNNSGTFNKLANNDCRTNTGVTFVNAGTLNVHSPNWFALFGGQFRQTAGLTNLISGAHFMSSPLPHLFEGGVVRGTGTIEGAVNNSGAEISPGSSAGILTVDGNYTQGSSGALAIEIGGLTPGTQHDQLLVTGAATLAGTLNVTLSGGYLPNVGDTFTVMTYGSRTGTFSNVNSGCTGRTWSIAYNSTNVVLTVTGTAPICTATPTPPPSTPTAVASTPTATPCASFTDVPEGHTFYPFVMCLVNRGIVSGYPDCTFRPNNDVTRGQLSKIVSLAANFIDPTGSQIFEDVAPGSTFYDYVQRLAGRAILGGYACGGAGEPCVPPGNRPYFRPNNNATRGQISKVVSNAANFTDPPGAQLFEDIPPGSTFYDFVQRLAGRAILGGYACGGAGEPCVPPGNRPYFRSNNNATRGQVSKIVANTFYPNCQP